VLVGNVVVCGGGAEDAVGGKSRVGGSGGGVGPSGLAGLGVGAGGGASGLRKNGRHASMDCERGSFFLQIIGLVRRRSRLETASTLLTGNEEDEERPFGDECLKESGYSFLAKTNQE